MLNAVFGNITCGPEIMALSIVRRVRSALQWTSALLPPLKWACWSERVNGNGAYPVFVGEKRLKGRLTERGKGERLFLAGELPALPSNPSPSDNTPSPRNRVQSSEGGSPGYAGGDFFGPFSGVLPGTVLQAPAGTPDSF